MKCVSCIELKKKNLQEYMLMTSRSKGEEKTLTLSRLTLEKSEKSLEKNKFESLKKI